MHLYTLYTSTYATKGTLANRIRAQKSLANSNICTINKTKVAIREIRANLSIFQQSIWGIFESFRPQSAGWQTIKKFMRLKMNIHLFII